VVFDLQDVGAAVEPIRATMRMGWKRVEGAGAFDVLDGRILLSRKPI